MKKTGPRKRGPAFVISDRPHQFRWKDQRWGLRERLQEQHRREQERQLRHRNRKLGQLRNRKRERQFRNHRSAQEHSNRCDEPCGLRGGSSGSCIAEFRNRKERQRLRNHKEQEQRLHNRKLGRLRSHKQERLRSMELVRSRWVGSTSSPYGDRTDRLQRPRLQSSSP
jgi:hypothetical protein